MSDTKLEFDFDFVDKLKHSPIRNYVIPGLTSWMIGNVKESGGCIRLFECERNHVEQIVPHSHRFDFKCQVLEGHVINRVWRKREAHQDYESFDSYMVSELVYLKEFGRYKQVETGQEFWRFYDKSYKAGTSYAMKAEEVHSIIFSKGAKVLFEEGPTVSDRSIILEPIVNNEVIPTFQVESWMFKKESGNE